jgi:hypothetical protein
MSNDELTFKEPLCTTCKNEMHEGCCQYCFLQWEKEQMKICLKQAARNIRKAMKNERH